MKHIFEQKVYYSDTDSYGVVWHGSYLKWMEMGRVDWCENLGFNLVELENNDIVLPVTNLNIKYKQSARLNDILTVETELIDVSRLSVTFRQVIKVKDSGVICTSAEVTIVAINKAGKLYRSFPQVLAEKFEQELKCPELV